jgi:hypothetical protein
MKKILYILKEMFYLIRQHKLYFFAPLLIILGILAILVFYIGPSVIISFIYAGI